jgi:tetratricopeptide (TPR) repeat protein
MSRSGGAANAEQASAHSKGANADRRINIQMMQNVLLIWLEYNIDENSIDYRNTIVQLRCTVNDIKTFTDRDQCIDFLTDIHNENVLMVISDALCQNIVPFIHDVPHLQTIFVFCRNKTQLEQWTKDWSKVKGVFTEISQVCEALKQAVQLCERNTTPISFAATSDDVSKKGLDQLPPSFMYTQILKEILLSIHFEQRHFVEFIHYCRDMLVENESQLRNVDKLQSEYRDEMSIWWYTYECFLYSMLNRALRVMDVDIIIKIGFFICDLHRHIEHLHKQQFVSQNSDNRLTLYRGQGMLKTDFEQMRNNKGGLISFNSFLSTSKNFQHSLFLAESNQANPALMGILFVMTIDSATSSAPFASINCMSQFADEDEVLFSMHTIFRIGNITLMDENHRLFRVELTLTSDNDKDLCRLANHIREETFPNVSGWYRLSQVLVKMGQSEKAQRVCEILLEKETTESEKAFIYNQLGQVKDNLGEYQEAIRFHEKAFAIQQQSLPPNHPDLASSYNNIGNVYDSMGDYSKALSSHEKALAIQQQSLPPNHPDLAHYYSNIGVVYQKMGDYSKALSSYEKYLEISQKSLPPNHPDLAKSYNNIGVVYQNMGDYPKALSSHEKALAIQQQSLPPNHPDLAYPYNNIGVVYKNMGDYSKALSYYEKDLEISQKSLPPNHPHLAYSYGNIGIVYENMGDYPKALWFDEKALTIQQKALPPNHPYLAKSYGIIGNVYENMGDYSKALSSYEKALTIRQQSLPPNHPDLSSAYCNIGNVYKNMGDYPKALPYYEKDLEIRQQSLPPNHPDLASAYRNMGNVYKNMGDYPKALRYYEKDLEIRQQSLPPNHPDLASSYNKISVVYDSMGDYPKAISSLEKAIAIRQQSLPPNHPELAVSRYVIGWLYEKMGNYSKACSSYERALEIGQKSLPPNHSHLQCYRKKLADMKKKL